MKNKPGDIFFSWKFLFFLSLLVNLVFLLLTFSNLNDSQLQTYFNSDTLYLPSIFRDLFVDGSGIRGWHLNGAPNFIPDMFLYFAVNAIIPDFKAACIVFSMVQYHLLLLLLYFVFSNLDRISRFRVLATGNLVLPWFLLVTLVSGDFVFTYYLLGVSYHLGAYLMCLLALTLTTRYLESQAGRFLVLLFLTGFLATISDRLFIVMYVMPVLVVVLFFKVPSLRRRTLLVLCVSLGMTILGILAFNFIKSRGIVSVIGTEGKVFNFGNVGNSFRVMTKQHLRYLELMDFRGVIVLTSLLSFAGSFIFWIRDLIRFFRTGSDDGYSVRSLFFLGFSTAFFLLVLFMPVINGNYYSWAILRYNIYALYLMVFSVGYLLYLLARGRLADRILRITCVAGISAYLILASVIMYRQPIREGLQKTLSYYPPVVRCADEMARETKLVYGAAWYWNAKLVTMFSKEGLRVYTVLQNMDAWYHVMNENWYYPGGKGKYGNPEFRFLIPDDLDSSAVNRTIGHPAQIFRCSDSMPIYLYPEFAFDPVSRKPYLLRQEGCLQTGDPVNYSLSVYSLTR